MKVNNQKGFTLIELVLVITILGILAVAALPNFIDVSTDAAEASRDGVAGAVREGVALYRANDLVVNGPPGSYPTDAQMSPNSGQATTTNLLFTGVIQGGLADGSWTNNADGTYTYSNGTVSTIFTYAPAAGTFNE
ncbi:MAG: hypothetical protein A3G32_07085 [Deltaproteobacteria bacterium RIFCSPLOWO2_12_FULL_40_28]|nr:MAG: hypothetical protein A3C45_07130 [Deltaproteobacteria bacterium RIFCSPHIGHO2_02_FULL_40_28]OGQ19279.1 MAG: hypothetical protein A3E27_04685 [Deltaproteobacteria bacterium RIFCSPHIGHO2_12_FULL_40_32]OGQ40497.1 MAG: hypothetical protein A3I69_00385 [Deltaproteobacteria bacterium RIFCSPLOWO2_02_FULL_40_36]OGQ53733.1 MAG: hypothetical protein A3G32_07085 [Deltaproteobacteria bacterium RIFCSPLOWO2_12_FULL_40_28]